MPLQKQSYRGRGFRYTRLWNQKGPRRGVLHNTADGRTVEKEGEKTLIMSTADGAQLRKVTFQVANVNKALGSVSKMVRKGNRVVFDTSGSHVENRMKKDTLWLRQTDGVYVVDIWWHRQEENRRVNRLLEGGACSRACNST